MSIHPKFADHRFGPTGAKVNIIELYLDYVCPFSAKIFKKLWDTIIPHAEKKHPGEFQFIFRHGVQPWHPSSTLVHEAGIAVGRLAPDKFWVFSRALFEEQEKYFDTAVWNETRPATYVRLAELAHRAAGIDKENFIHLVSVPASKEAGKESNGGNEITADLKLFIRQARQNSIHVTPTVAVNGIVDSSIESSTTEEVWFEKLAAISASQKQ